VPQRFQKYGFKNLNNEQMRKANEKIFRKILKVKVKRLTTVQNLVGEGSSMLPAVPETMNTGLKLRIGKLYIGKSVKNLHSLLRRRSMI